MPPKPSDMSGPWLATCSETFEFPYPDRASPFPSYLDHASRHGPAFLVSALGLGS